MQSAVIILGLGLLLIYVPAPTIPCLRPRPSGRARKIRNLALPGVPSGRRPLRPASPPPLGTDIFPPGGISPVDTAADDTYFDGMTQNTGLCHILHETRSPSVDPEFGWPISVVMRSTALQRIVQDNMESLYRYQEKAFVAISSRRDVVITTPVASGKTEALLLPILDMILTGQRNTKPSAFFIYPTRSLAASHAGDIRKYADKCGITIQRLDGSVDSSSRMKIVSNPPDIIVTNFDMLAYHMSRHHRNQFSAWFVGALGNINTLVVNDAHTCTGFYGSNVKWMLYRILRLNPKIQFVASSAPISDTIRFCSSLFPRSMLHIDGIGARGETVLQFLVPSISKKSLTIGLARQFGLRGYQSMIFSNSAKDVEILAVDGSDEKMNIEVYKSGLAEKYRTKVETGLLDGSVMAVSCTPIRELDIIRNIKAVVTDYVPYDRLIHMMGRADRQGQKSFVYMILDGSNPIMAYYLRNPKRYFEDRLMHISGHDNDLVDENQLMLMAIDMNLTTAEIEEHGTMVKKLESEGLMNGSHCTLAGEKRALAWAIRDIGAGISLYAGGRNIGSIHIPEAFAMLYPGAILLHQKKTYRVHSYASRRKRGKAMLVQERIPHITNPIIVKSYDLQHVISSVSLGPISASYCRIRIKWSIAEYLEKPRNSDAEGESHDVSPPKYMSMDTLGVRLKLPVPDEDMAMHAVAHLLIHAARMVIGAEANEIGGTIDPESIILYDNSISGGNGFSKGIYDNLEAVIDRAAEIVNQCDCQEEDGCPRCIHMLGCSTSNRKLLKQEAIRLLHKMRGTQDFNQAESPVIIIEDEWS